jgi:predicted ABC-type ATPase
MSQSKSIDEAPRAVIIAGPNGSGKTTIAREYLQIHHLDYLSADEIAEELAPGDIERVRLEAGRQFFTRLARRIDTGGSFLAETTFAGKGFRRILDQLQHAGYSITIIFVFVDSAEMCVWRVRERIRKGGHSVPEQDIIRRFHRSIANFWWTYRGYAKRWHLIYNGSNQAQEAAIGESSEVTQRDEPLYQRFLRIVGGQRDE